MGVPFSNANRIRFIEASTLSRWPSSPSGWDSPQGVPPPTPSLQRMGFASRESPSQQRMGFASRGSPSPREWDSRQEGHPLQSEWDSHQGVTLSKANGIRFYPLHSEWDSLQDSEGHPLSTANGIRTKRVTLSKANGIHF